VDPPRQQTGVPVHTESSYVREDIDARVWSPARERFTASPHAPAERYPRRLEKHHGNTRRRQWAGRSTLDLHMVDHLRLDQPLLDFLNDEVN
jgi:hypothetical protein